MAAVQVRGATGEAAAAEFVVLQPVEIGVQAARRFAFAQVKEGFHSGSKVGGGVRDEKTESDITFSYRRSQGKRDYFSGRAQSVPV